MRNARSVRMMTASCYNSNRVLIYLTLCEYEIKHNNNLKSSKQCIDLAQIITSRFVFRLLSLVL